MLEPRHSGVQKVNCQCGGRRQWYVRSCSACVTISLEAEGLTVLIAFIERFGWGIFLFGVCELFNRPQRTVNRMMESIPLMTRIRSAVFLFGLLLSVTFVAIEAHGQRVVFNNDLASEWSITDTTKQTGGMQIAVSCGGWIGSRPGYLPIRVTATSWPAAVFPENATLTVHVGAIEGAIMGGFTEAVLTIPIEANTSKATGEMLVNFMDDSYYINVACYRDGRYLSGQSTNFYIQPSFTGNVREGAKAVVVLPNETEKLDAQLVKILNSIRTKNAYTMEDIGGNSHLALSMRCVYADPKRLPPSWLYLSNAHTVCVDIDTFEQLPEEDTRKLKNYAMAGGALTIANVKSFDRLQKVLDLELSRDIADDSKSGKRSTATSISDPSDAESSNKPLDQRVDRARFFEYGFGMVWSMPMSVTDPEFRSQQPVLGAEMSLRTGLNARSERFESGVGDDYWEWLIPSVKKTPVLLFLGITLFFVGIVSPGVLIWSGAHRRRVWLLVLMPLIAIAVTGFLSFYAIIYDGFRTSLRCRSLTFVDRSGDGFVWSRQSYFSSSLPRDGIKVSTETQLVPFSPRNLVDERHVLQRQSDDQHIYEGLIPIRTTSQFFVAHPVSKLQVFEFANGSSNLSDSLELKNAMSSGWLGAVFVNQKGEYFETGAVEPGKIVKLEPATRDQAVSRLMSLYRKQELAAPLDAPSVDNESMSEVMSDIFGMYRVKSNSLGKIFEENIWRSNCAEQALLRPMTYVVYCDRADYLTKLIDKSSESDGIHAIVGRW